MKDRNGTELKVGDKVAFYITSGIFKQEHVGIVTKIYDYYGKEVCNVYNLNKVHMHLKSYQVKKI